MPNHPSDPRPDKVTDHKHWKNVLHNAWHLNKDLYGVLHGVRCGGAEIVQTANSFMLMQGSWDEEISWDEIKQKWLSPHKGQLIKVFRMSRLGLITDEDFGVFDKGEINND